VCLVVVHFSPLRLLLVDKLFKSPIVATEVENMTLFRICHR
jgi:hypothetical protein